jgi:hypothetical protein
VVSIVDQALAKKGMEIKPVERWKAEMPKEQEMVPRDKYTIFDRKEKKYRKAIHSRQLPVPIDAKTDILTLHRITQVDESFSACQPPWILELRWDGVGCTILWLWILQCMAGVYGRLMYDGDKYVYRRMNVSIISAALGFPATPSLRRECPLYCLLIASCEYRLPSLAIFFLLLDALGLNSSAQSSTTFIILLTVFVTNLPTRLSAAVLSALLEARV